MSYVRAPPSENRVSLPFGAGETLFSEGGFNVMLDIEIRTYGICQVTFSAIFGALGSNGSLERWGVVQEPSGKNSKDH